MANFESSENSTMENACENRPETSEKMLEKLRCSVKNNYEEHAVPENVIKQFIVHNLQVEDFVKKFSNLERFGEEEKEIAILSAILHDVTKGYGDFLDHGNTGGVLAEKILLGNGVDKKLAEDVKYAIQRHMGEEGYVAEEAKKFLEMISNMKFPKPKRIKCFIFAIF